MTHWRPASLAFNASLHQRQTHEHTLAEPLDCQCAPSGPLQVQALGSQQEWLMPDVSMMKLVTQRRMAGMHIKPQSCPLLPIFSCFVMMQALLNALPCKRKHIKQIVGHLHVHQQQPGIKRYRPVQARTYTQGSLAKAAALHCET